MTGRKIILSFFLCAFSLTVTAQMNNVPLSSLYMFNGLMINPAYAGSHEVLSSVFSHRKQWVGFTGAPTSQDFAIHTPLAKGDKKDNFMALGIMGMFEQTPVTKTSEFYIDYAYHIKINNITGGRLALGLQAGINHAVVDYTINQDYRSMQVFNTYDPAFSFRNPVTIPNFGFGAYYYTNEYYLGLSVPRFFSFPSDTTGTSSGPVFRYSQMNFLATGGVVITFNPNFRFKPSAMVRYSPSLGVQTDLNANFIMFRDKLWIGASYRSDNTVIALLEIQVSSQIKLGYAYDYSLNEIRNYTSGSHEFQLRYELNYRIKAVNPKFF